MDQAQEDDKRTKKEIERDNVIKQIYGIGEPVPILSCNFNELIDTGYFNQIVDSRAPIKFSTNRKCNNLLGRSSLTRDDSWIMECKIETKNEVRCHVLSLSKDYGKDAADEQKIRGAILPSLLCSVPMGLPLSVDEAAPDFWTYKFLSWSFTNPAEDSQIAVFYNAEVDAFIYGNQAVEIKAVQCSDSGEAILPLKTALRILKQCELGGIPFIVVGYHHNNRLIRAELYSREELHKYVYKKSKKYQTDMAEIQSFKDFNLKAAIETALCNILHQMKLRKTETIYIGKAFNSHKLEFDVVKKDLANRINREPSYYKKNKCISIVLKNAN